MGTPDLNPQNDAILHLPEELLSQIKNMAQNQHTDAAGIVEQAIHLYRIEQIHGELDAIHRELPPTQYTPEDVPRLIREVRAEMRAEEESARRH